MNKYKYLLIGVVCIAIALLICSSILKDLHKHRAYTMPNIVVKDISNNQYYNTTDNYNRISFIYIFDIDCEICKEKISIFCNNDNIFKNTNVLFITNSPIVKVKRFLNDNNIKVGNNIHYCIALNSEVIEEFDIMALPAIFIYNKQNILVKKFNFSCKIKEITSILNKYK